MRKPFCSIILPLYNQKDQLKTIINNYSRYLKKTRKTFEIILVINGPDDNSYNIAKKLTQNINYVSIYKLKTGGWGRAVRHGLKKSKGKYICYTNSARTNIKDLLMLLKYAEVNDNAVIKATRIIREDCFRKLGSVLYNFETRLIFKIPIWDVNGTPKVIPRKILDKITLSSNGDLIDIELLVKLFKLSIPIIEVPIKLTKRVSGRSTTNIISAIKMYWGVFVLKNKI